MQEHNAGECKDRIRVYPSVVLRFYKHRCIDATQHIVVLSREPAFICYIIKQGSRASQNSMMMLATLATLINLAH